MQAALCEAALRILVDRFVATGNPDGWTVAAWARMMRTCRAWRDALARDALLWRHVVVHHLSLSARRCAATPEAVAERMRRRARCLECGRRDARPCRVGDVADAFRHLRCIHVCTHCSVEPGGFRRLLDRHEAHCVARRASNGFRRKGRNVAKILRMLPLARRTRAGRGIKSLYWAHEVSRACARWDEGATP